MDAQKVDMFIMTHGKQLPQQQLSFIREKLLSLSDDKWATLSQIEFKDATLALIISLIFGTFGIDRFYIGDIGTGIGKLITCGGFGFWTIIDLFLIMDATRNVNYTMLQQYLVSLS
ncbi:MAG TPA: hypothetical protein DEO38_02900 [Bacteroidales bacterium]|jgi:hypothetical protein|nr:hypothetical protein [Bacteroidales bacterium]